MSSEPRPRPIETEIGVIRYRDAIFLDDFDGDLSRGIRSRGAISGDAWIDYELEFGDVLAHEGPVRKLSRAPDRRHGPRSGVLGRTVT
jgi:hypothetical protein